MSNGVGHVHWLALHFQEVRIGCEKPEIKEGTLHFVVIWSSGTQLPSLKSTGVRLVELALLGKQSLLC